MLARVRFPLVLPALLPSQHCSSVPRALLMIAVLGLHLPAGAMAHNWTVGLAGGYVGSGPFTTETYGQTWNTIPLEGVAIASIRVSRSGPGHWGLIGEATYLPYGDELRHARHVPVGLGLRYMTATGPDRTGSPYVEICPVLVWSDWNANLYYRESSLHPGVVAGLGTQGRIGARIGLDAGLRYFISTNGRTRRTGPQSFRFDGLRRAGVLLGLYYSL